MQNTPPGCICRLAGCGASRPLLSFSIAKRKEQRKMLTPYKEFRSLRGATRAPPWTCHPLKRVDLNFRPYEGVCRAIGPAWSLRLVSVTPIQSIKGRGIVSPCTHPNSRHPLSIRTVLSRVAAGRVRQRPSGRRRVGSGCGLQAAAIRPLQGSRGGCSCRCRWLLLSGTGFDPRP